ncbi:hypothetical protein F5X96DRAFT_671134 [Biscogniauxia mediterranea]|nr:hypothetical protein F5X96DRAFT_671134 [Biscogniauxia mediterranea]
MHEDPMQRNARRRSVILEAPSNLTRDAALRLEESDVAAEGEEGSTPILLLFLLLFLLHIDTLRHAAIVPYPLGIQLS